AQEQKLDVAASDESAKVDAAVVAGADETATADKGDDDELEYWNHMAEEFKKKMNEAPEKYEGFFDSPEYNFPGLQDFDTSDEQAAGQLAESDEYIFSEDIEK